MPQYRQSDYDRQRGVVYADNSHPEKTRRSETPGDKSNINAKATYYANLGWNPEDAFEKARQDILEKGTDSIGRARARAKKVFGDDATDADAYAIGSLNGSLGVGDERELGVRVPSGEELQRQRDDQKVLVRMTEEEFVQHNMDRRFVGAEPLDHNNPEHWYVWRDPVQEERDRDYVGKDGQQYNAYGHLIRPTSG